MYGGNEMFLDPFYKMPNPIELLLSKSKVVITGHIWKFYIENVVFEVNDISTPVQFRELYFTHTGKPAPSFSKSTWCKFLEDIEVSLKDIDREIVTDIERILQAISDMPISDDPMKSITNNKNEPVYLYDSGLFVCLPVYRLEWILQDVGSDLPLPLVSQILTVWGYKIRSTSMISYDCNIIQSYEFIKTCDFFHNNYLNSLTV
jgi:hypothetical protein